MTALSSNRLRLRTAALMLAAILPAACAGDEVPTQPRFEAANRPAEPAGYPNLGGVPARPKDLTAVADRAALQRRLEEEREAIRRGEPVAAWRWPDGGKSASPVAVGRTFAGPDLALGLPAKPAAPAAPAGSPVAAKDPAADAAPPPRPGLAAPPPPPDLAVR